MPLQGIVGAGLGLLGNIFNAGMQDRINQQQFDFQKEMYNRQREDALSDWHMQNEYNLPKNAMARLADAGLNPNSLYSNGGVVPTVNSLPHQAQYHSPNITAPHLSLGELNLERVVTEIKNLKKQGNVLDSEAEKNRAQAGESAAETEIKKLRSRFDTVTFDLRVAMLEGQKDQVFAEIRKLDQDIAASKAITGSTVKLQESQIKLNKQQEETLIFGRAMQWAHYELEAWQIGEQLRLKAEEIANGRIAANAAATNAAAHMLRTVKENELTDEQIGLAAMERAQQTEYYKSYSGKDRGTHDYLKNETEVKKGTHEREAPKGYHILRGIMHDTGKLIPFTGFNY